MRKSRLLNYAIMGALSYHEELAKDYKRTKSEGRKRVLEEIMEDVRADVHDISRLETRWLEDEDDGEI